MNPYVMPTIYLFMGIFALVAGGGVIAPFLISAKNSLFVVLGFASLPVTGFITVWLLAKGVKGIHTPFDKEGNEKSNNGSHADCDGCSDGGVH